MSNEKQKDDKAPTPKKVEGAESELDNESLDGVSGGMRPAIPVEGPAGLSSLETDKCISQ